MSEPVTAQTEAAGKPRGYLSFENVLLALMLAACLAPVWAFEYFPTSDGPAHLASADIMRHIRDPQYPTYQRYCWVNRTPMPNLAGHWILAGLMSAKVPPLVAEKLLLSLYIVLLPLAFRYALRAIRPGGSGACVLSLLVFPFVFSFPLHGGFYNYCLSIAVLFFAAGYWLRNRQRMNLPRAAVLAALMAVLYTCHMFSLMVAILLIGTMVLWTSFLAGRQGGERTGWKPVLRELWRHWPTALAMLPFVAVVGRYYVKTRGQTAIGVAWSLWDGLRELIGGTPLVAYQSAERWWIVPLLAVLAATAGWFVVRRFRSRQWRPADGLLVVIVGCLALYFKSLDAGSTQYYIPLRLGLTIYLLLALWVGAQEIPIRLARNLALIAIAVTLGLTALRVRMYREFNVQIRQYVSVLRQVPPHSTVLPLVLSPKGWTQDGEGLSHSDVAPLLFATGYVVTLPEHADIVDLANYELDLPYFAARYRDDARPFKHLWTNTDRKEPPLPIDIAAYEWHYNMIVVAWDAPLFIVIPSPQPVRVDYVLLWLPPEEMRSDPVYLDYIRQLATLYVLQDESSEGLAQLWRRR